jgi:glycine amidinotransferase
VTDVHECECFGEGLVWAGRGPVWSENEWDPLEEVIVGSVRGARMPHWDVTVQATMPAEHHKLFHADPGRPFPQELVDAAEEELDAFCRTLEAAGVTVRRPAAFQHHRPFSTPEWSSQAGLYSAMPRDCLLVVGDEIIEAPMAWRSRYFETHAFRALLREYFEGGARWTAAPRPRLLDEQFATGYQVPNECDQPSPHYAVTEFEPTFDAADFVRMGSDIYGQRSHVTNEAGIEWLRRHLRWRYRVHELTVYDSHPMHIDATLVPLAPGKLLVHPTRVRELPEPLADWERIVTPLPVMADNPPLHMTSRWLSMNVLSLDERRVFVEAGEEPLAEVLAMHGFEPVMVPFRTVCCFGGSFHCVTLDVRRRPA